MLMKYQHDKEIEMNIDFLSYFDDFVSKEVMFHTKTMLTNRLLPNKWMSENTDTPWSDW